MKKLLVKNRGRVPDFINLLASNRYVWRYAQAYEAISLHYHETQKYNLDILAGRELCVTFYPLDAPTHTQQCG